MDLDQIKQILDLVREHELSEFEIEHEGLRLKIRKDANGAHVVTAPRPRRAGDAAPALPRRRRPRRSPAAAAPSVADLGETRSSWRW